MSDDRCLTEREARTLTLLSQRFGSLRRLARELNTTPPTIDRVAMRSRRVRPAKLQSIRVGLQRCADHDDCVEHLELGRSCFATGVES